MQSDYTKIKVYSSFSFPHDTSKSNYILQQCDSIPYSIEFVVKNYGSAEPRMVAQDLFQHPKLRWGELERRCTVAFRKICRSPNIDLVIPAYTRGAFNDLRFLSRTLPFEADWSALCDPSTRNAGSTNSRTWVTYISSSHKEGPEGFCESDLKFNCSVFWIGFFVVVFRI